MGGEKKPYFNPQKLYPRKTANASSFSLPLKTHVSKSPHWLFALLGYKGFFLLYITVNFWVGQTAPCQAGSFPA